MLNDSLERTATARMFQGVRMKNEQLNELLYESLETEIGGIQVYRTGFRCVVNDELKTEWEKYSRAN
jgi:hypothetical protein